MPHELGYCLIVSCLFLEKFLLEILWGLGWECISSRGPAFASARCVVWGQFKLVQACSSVDLPERVVPHYSLASELFKPGTSHILRRKNVSVLGTCMPLVSLDRTCMSHNTTPPPRKRQCFINHSLLITPQNELTPSTEVPL